jgi:hypothetical protein
LFRVCAWCECLLGISPPYADPDLAHGTCADCVNGIEREEPRTLGRTLIIVRRGRPDLHDWLEARSVDIAGSAIQVDRRTGERRVSGGGHAFDRRRRERRRPLSPGQAAAWRALGVVVVRLVPRPDVAVSDP